jgi:hypothetical protein
MTQYAAHLRAAPGRHQIDIEDITAAGDQITAWLRVTRQTTGGATRPQAASSSASKRRHPVGRPSGRQVQPALSWQAFCSSAAARPDRADPTFSSRERGLARSRPVPRDAGIGRSFRRPGWAGPHVRA